MANNYLSSQNPTDVSLQSEDGGGLIFTDKGKFLFGAKTQAELKDLTEKGHQGDVDVNPNTNTSFIGIMNDTSDAVPIDVASKNQYSLYSPPDVTAANPPNVECSNEVIETSVVLLLTMNEAIKKKYPDQSQKYGAYNLYDQSIKDGDINKAKEVFLYRYWNNNFGSDFLLKYENEVLKPSNFPPGLRIMIAASNYTRNEWINSILSTVGPDYLNSNIGVPYRLLDDYFFKFNRDTEVSIQYYDINGKVKSGKFVYNPRFKDIEKDKEFTLTSEERVDLFLKQYNQIIDVYNTDKEDFIDNLYDDIIRNIEQTYNRNTYDGTTVFSFEANEKEWNIALLDKAKELAIKYMDCPAGTQMRNTEIPQSTPAPTPTPTPPVSKTAQEVLDGIYEANFLPSSEDDQQVTYVYDDDQKINEEIVKLIGIGTIKTENISTANTPAKYNISAVTLGNIGPYVKFAAVGTVGKSNALQDWKDGIINPNTVIDIATAAKAAGVVATITTAKTGHSEKTKGGKNTSRHMDGTGVDVAIIDGIGAGGATDASNGNAKFRELGYKLKDALVQMGYKWNSESGYDKAVLWQTNTGGNHYNHLHVSNRIK